MAMPIVVSALVAYLLGAIPFGWIVARSRGVDIFTVGSKNIGATNVARCVGKRWGILTFILDCLKGYAACAVVAPLVFRLFAMSGHPVDPAPTPTALAGIKLLCGVMSVVGHSFPVFLKFRGGKGVATSAGLLLGIAPAGCGIAFAVWLAVFIASRYVSLASILAALTLAVVAWLIPAYRAVGWWLPAVLSVLAALVIIRHHANIARLVQGRELRFEFKKR